MDVPTWTPPWGPISFAPVSASSRIDNGDPNLSKKFSFWPFFSWTFLTNDPNNIIYVEQNMVHGVSAPIQYVWGYGKLRRPWTSKGYDGPCSFTV